MAHSFTLAVQELSRFSNVYSLNCKWYTSIKDIKDQLHRHVNCPPSRMRLYHGSTVKTLSNPTTLHDLGIEENGHVLRLVMDITSSDHVSIIPSKDIEVDNDCKKLLAEVRRGLQQNKVPIKTDLLEGTGGVYFMKASSGARVAVFKPSDEEQGMPNNPKGHGGNGEHGLRDFMKPGDGYIREAAAYMLDYMNFSNVPATTIAHCEHPTFEYPGYGTRTKETFPKIGSIQSYCRAGDTFEDISSSMISVFELQKIAVLDIRLLNCDRNSSNMLAMVKNESTPRRQSIGGRRDSRSSSMGSAASLDEDGNVRESEFIIFPDDFEASEQKSSKSKYQDSYELIPIDHGYCLPPKLCIDEFDWAWMDCPQIAEKVDPEIYRYIMSLDIDSMITKLKKELPGLPEDSLYLMRVSHLLLREGVKAGLTLKAIACMIARMSEDTPSPLENALNVAADNSYRAIEMRSSRLNNRSDAPPFLSQWGGFVKGEDKRIRGVSKPLVRLSLKDKNHINTGEYDNEVSNSNSGNGDENDMPLTALNMFQAKPFRNISTSPKETDESGKTTVESKSPANSTASLSSTSYTFPSRETSGSRTLLCTSRRESPVEGVLGQEEGQEEEAQYFLIDLDESPRAVLEEDIGHGIRIEKEGIGISMMAHTSQGKPLVSMQTLDPYVLRSTPTFGSTGPSTSLGSETTSNPHYYPFPVSSPKVTLRNVTSTPDHLVNTSNTYRHQPPPALHTQEAGSGFGPLVEGDNMTSSECSSSYEKGSPKSMTEFMSKAFESRFLPIPLPMELGQEKDHVHDDNDELVHVLEEPRSREVSVTGRSPFRSTASSPSLESLLASEIITGDELSPRVRGKSYSTVLPGPLSLSMSTIRGGGPLRRMDAKKDTFAQTLSASDMHAAALADAEKTLDGWDAQSDAVNSSCSSISRDSYRKVNNRRSITGKHSDDMQPLGLTRVISLGAFESPPIYDESDSLRQTTRLRRNRRKTVTSTADFQELRLKFVTEAVQALINKESRVALKAAVGR